MWRPPAAHADRDSSVPEIGCGDTAWRGFRVRTRHQHRLRGDRRNTGIGKSLAQLRIHLDDVDAAGAGIHGAGHTARTSMPATGPAAHDPVSLTATHSVYARIATIAAHSDQAGEITMAAGALVRADAAAYAHAESANAENLGAAAGQSRQVPALTTTRANLRPPLPASAEPAPAPVRQPTSGRRIAELIHRGSPDASWSRVADDLRAHAAVLAETNTRLNAAVDDMAAAWQSDAGHTAEGRIADAAAWYGRHAEHARTAAQVAAAQVEAFTTARATIPPPGAFAAVEHRLQAAARANTIPPPGRYHAVIADLQQQLSRLNAQAVDGYRDYAEKTDANLRRLHSPIQPLSWLPRTAPAVGRPRPQPALGFDPAAPLAGDLPLGSDAVIVWCVALPSGFRCTNLFTDGHTSCIRPRPIAQERGGDGRQHPQ